MRTPTVTVEAAPSTTTSSSPEAGATPSASGRRPSVNPAMGVGKPVLIRQDCTTYLHSSGGLGYGLGGSEESATSATGCNEDTATRSVPDLELHCRLTGQVSNARCTDTAVAR